MKIESVIVDGVEIPPRHRVVVPGKVTALAESMSTIGLIHPIMVYADDDMGSVHLISGLHRLEAAKQLGWFDMDAVFLYIDDIDRELIEIDENLCRADLTEAEQAQHLARRKELWIAREGSGTTCSTQDNLGRQISYQQSKGFAAETAVLTGKSKQDINRKISRAEKIHPDILAAITGTEWDKGTNLDVLKKLNHAEQQQAWERIQDGVSSGLNGLEGAGAEATKDKQMAALMSAWNRAGTEARQEFLQQIGLPGS